MGCDKIGLLITLLSQSVHVFVDRWPSVQGGQKIGTDGQYSATPYAELGLQSTGIIHVFQVLDTDRSALVHRPIMN